MPLPVPDLDDRTFDQLAAEARALIPKNFLEWTDHNPSDPGITLLELFAFLLEAAIYQINRIPERSLEHFAELVGVTRGEGEAIEKMLGRALDALTEKSRTITAADFESLVTTEFTLTKRVFSNQPTLRCDHQAGVSAIMMEMSPDMTALDQDAVAGATDLILASSANLTANDVIMIDDDVRIEFVQIVSISPEAVVVTVNISSPLRFDHARGVKLTKVLSPIPKTATTLAAIAKTDDSIIVLEPLEQQTIAGVLRLDTDTLTEYVCVQGIAIARVKVLIEAVDPDREAITLTVQSVSDSAINVTPFNSGALGLPRGSFVTKISSMQNTHLAKDILSHQIGVTQISVHDSSFVTLLMQGDQLKVTAKSNVFPDEQFVNAIIVPNDPNTPEPTPTDGLRQQIFKFLRSRCLITTRVKVVEPKYTSVHIKTTVVRDHGSRLDRKAVQQNVKGTIIEFLSPLKGGVDSKGWEFGRSVFRSELYQRIEDTPGVDHVKRLLMNGDEAVGELQLPSSTSLVRLDKPEVTVVET